MSHSAAKLLMSAALTATGALALSACSTTASSPEPETLGRANLTTAQGVPVGVATLTAYNDRLVLAVSGSGLPPGPHGIHLHTKGECTAPGFTSAGGHLNPRGRKHGSMTAEGPHEGDLPNLEVDSVGNAKAQFDIAGERAQASDWIFDNDGTAIVLHAGPDDYRTDPSGNSGARLACGVLTPTSGG